MNILRQTDLGWLERALDMSYRRHSILSGNLANIDTPDYVPVDLDFRDHLRTELRERELAGTPLTSLSDPQVSPRLDGNTVSVDDELAKVSANSLFYNLASEIFNRRAALLKYAIDEGGR